MMTPTQSVTPRLTRPMILVVMKAPPRVYGISYLCLKWGDDAGD